ncbi:MAG: MlaD family protein [Lentisphaerae bacterium]|nr:MlaD family protein [Lentisphaerota bacterium]
MAKPFKFRYVNEIVGTFVLFIVALLMAGILLAGHAQEWFTPVRRFHVDFPVEGSLGIQKGAAVEILGTSVGKVERIVVEDDGHMAGVLSVKGDFLRFVRSDSKAIVKKRFGIAGDAFIEITKGQGDLLDPAARLAAVKDTELTEMMEDLLKQIRETTVPAIEELRQTVGEYGKLAADLRNPDEPLMKLLANLEQITAGLGRGEGAAGKMLRDPQVADDLKGILDKINAALDDLKRTTAQLPPMAAKLGDEVDDLPGLVLQTQETIRESERLIEGIQHHWLIRSYVPQPEPSALIPASEVRAP